MRRPRQMVASMAISALLHAAVLVAVGAWVLDRSAGIADREGHLVRVSLSGPGDDAESHRDPGQIPGLWVPAAVPEVPAGTAVKAPEPAPKQRLRSPGGAHSARAHRFAAIPAPVAPTAPAEARPAPVEATPPPGEEPPERAGAESAAGSERDERRLDERSPPPAASPSPDDRGARSAAAPAGEVEPAGDALPRSKDEPGSEEEGLANERAPEPATREEPPPENEEASPPAREELVAMAQPPAPPAPGTDERVDSARRALASANELLDRATGEGGETGARLAEAAAALAAAEEKLRDLEATTTSQIGATPQAGPPAALPLGGGAGSPGAPQLGGDGRLDALAQDRVDYVISLIGPSAARRAGHGGTGRVAFRVDERGYVREMEIRRSTGDGRLDGEIEPALHLAEPFAATPEWILVMVHFER